MGTGEFLLLAVCLIAIVIVTTIRVLGDDKPGASTSTGTGCGQSHAVVRVYPTKQRPDDVVMVRW